MNDPRLSTGTEKALLHYLKGKAMHDDGRVRLDISFDELLMLRAAMSRGAAQSVPQCGEPVAWRYRERPHDLWRLAEEKPQPKAGREVAPLYATPAAEPAPSAGDAVAQTVYYPRGALFSVKDRTIRDDEGGEPELYLIGHGAAFWVKESLTVPAAPQPQAGMREVLIQALDRPTLDTLTRLLDGRTSFSGFIADGAADIIAPRLAQGVHGNGYSSRPRDFLAWAVEMFGPVAKVRSERLLRFIEEAIELAHAEGMERTTINVMADRVYSRPAGHTPKEIGQAQACLETFAENIGLSSADEAEREWQRVQGIPQEEWTRRHSAKQALGLALPSTNREGES